MRRALLLVTICAALAPRAAPALGAVAQSDAVPSIDQDQAGRQALYLGVIESLRREGKPYAALAHLDAYKIQYPRDARAEILRANCLADTGDQAAAEALYQRLQTGPAADEAEAGLGRLFAGRKNWTAAAEAFAKAVRLKPTRAAYLYELGFALVQGGRSADGLFRLRQALELAPDDAAGRTGLIAALRAAGKTDEADSLSGVIEARSPPSARPAALAAAEPQSLFLRGVK